MSIPKIIDPATPGFGTIVAPRLLRVAVNRIVEIALAVLRWLAVTIVAIALSPIWVVLFSIRLIQHGKIDIERDPWLRPVAKLIGWSKNPLFFEREHLGLDSAVIDFHEGQGPKPGIKAYADVLVLNSVADIFSWKQRLIQTATQSIEWSFNYAGGAPFRLCLDLISAQMNKNLSLKVHLILSDDLLTKNDKLALRQIKRNFVDRFHALVTVRDTKLMEEFRFEENHVKVLVVDGKYFSFGGAGVQNQMVRETFNGNETEDLPFGAKVMDACFRDTEILGRSFAENNIAETMRGQFFSLYRIWSQRMHRALKGEEGLYFPLDSLKGECLEFQKCKEIILNTEMRLLLGGPEHAGKNPISQSLVSHFQNAKKVIRIANLLFNPSRKTLEAFKGSQAEKIGYFNSTAENHSSARFAFANLTRQHYYLFSKIHEYSAPNQLYHKKVVVIDDKISYVGSYNFGKKSDRCDYELMGVFEDERVAAALQEGLDQDEKVSKTITDSKESVRSKIHAWPFNLVGPLFF